MSEKRIVGIDIGSYAVKVVYLEPKAGELMVLGHAREKVREVAPAAPTDEAESPSPERAAEPPPTPGEPIPFEDETTNVREPAAETIEHSDEPEPTEPAADAEEGGPAELEVDDSPDWLRCLQRLAARDAFVGELQSTFVPEGRAMTIELEVPFEDEGKVANILPHLMTDRLPLSQSEIVWDFHTYPALDPDAEGARAIVGFATNDDVEASLANLAEADIDPVMLGIPEMQLAVVGVRLLGGPQQEPVAFVDLGHETTRVVVVHGWHPLLGRTVRTGGRHVTDALADTFGETFEVAEQIKHKYAAILDEQSAPNEDMRQLSNTIEGALRPIVRDLRRTFRGLFAKNRVEIARVFVCGGTSQIRNLEKYLSAELGVPVRRLPTHVPGMTDPEMAATGTMALGAAFTQQNEVARARSINLRKGRFAYRGRSSYLRRQIMFVAAAIVGLLLVLGVVLYAKKMSHEAKRDAMRSAVAEQTTALFGTELTSRDAVQMVMEGEDSGANSIVPKMSAYELLYELTTRLSDEVELELSRIEVDTDRNLVQIYGETTDARAVDKIVSDLEAIECLKEIKKDKLRVRDEKAEFELQISSGCS